MTRGPLGGVAALVLLPLLFLLAALPVSAQDAAEPCARPMPLLIGQNVFTRPGVFIRNQPSISGGQVEYYAASRTLRVVGGPVCADGFNWWQIEGPGNPGWVAEGRPGFQLIFPDSDVIVDTGDCGAPLINLSDGQALRMITAARVRHGPGFHMPVLTTLAFNTPMQVRGAPVCVYGVHWWPVWAPSGGQFFEAWVAETSDGTVLVEAIQPRTSAQGELCAPPYRRLHVGLRAVVAYRDNQPKNLRAEPGRGAAVLAQLVEEIAVDIIGGPVCADGLNWWQVQVVGSPETSGWMAEGGTAAGGYWLFPLDLYAR